MSVFSEDELRYLTGGRQLGRIAPLFIDNSSVHRLGYWLVQGGLLPGFASRRFTTDTAHWPRKMNQPQIWSFAPPALDRGQGGAQGAEFGPRAVGSGP